MIRAGWSPFSSLPPSAPQAQALADGVTTDDLAADRQRHDAPLRNFTVLGEAGQLSDEVKKQFPAINWQPARVDLDHYRIRKQTHAGGLINEYRLVA